MFAWKKNKTWTRHKTLAGYNQSYGSMFQSKDTHIYFCQICTCFGDQDRDESQKKKINSDCNRKSNLVYMQTLVQEVT